MEKETRSLAYLITDTIEEFTKFATITLLQKFSLDHDCVKFYCFKRSNDSGSKALGVTQKEIFLKLTIYQGLHKTNVRLYGDFWIAD